MLLKIADLQAVHNIYLIFHPRGSPHTTLAPKTCNELVDLYFLKPNRWAICTKCFTCGMITWTSLLGTPWRTVHDPRGVHGRVEITEHFSGRKLPNAMLWACRSAFLIANRKHYVIKCCHKPYWGGYPQSPPHPGLPPRTPEGPRTLGGPRTLLWHQRRAMSL